MLTDHAEFSFYILDFTELLDAIKHTLEIVSNTCDSFSPEIIVNDLKDWLLLEKTDLNLELSKYVWSFLGFNISNSHKKYKSQLKKKLSNHCVERKIINFIWSHPVDYYKYQISWTKDDLLFRHGTPPLATARGICHVKKGMIHHPLKELSLEERKRRNDFTCFNLKSHPNKITPSFLGWEIGIFLGLFQLDYYLSSQCDEIIANRDIHPDEIEQKLLKLILLEGTDSE
ncbi:hypothetical protein [Gimesia aquarii]|uniref:Uncharacterized protein n=1 Tax=Gimesia aquarii TaxID=2527964 RepID=A0A517WUY5_9PLAN|nr:hypothetical protein [Gimesia aquarii]QDU09054.1 hypothetical protein V202x_24250 [Gimesia aquarii]